jgi:hypothetical protein
MGMLSLLLLKLIQQLPHDRCERFTLRLKAWIVPRATILKHSRPFCCSIAAFGINESPLLLPTIIAKLVPFSLIYFKFG